jgi:predicted cupin superfamily sugar epimerase
MTDPRDLVERLGMRAHPEGGWYVETWLASGREGSRPASSAILFLLASGERSHWHRLDADEVWHWSAGDDLELRTWTDGDAAVEVHRLGGDVTGAAGTTLQATVPAGAWQAARTLGAWTLVGCIVAPAFEFDGFTLAAPDWEPPPP